MFADKDWYANLCEKYTHISPNTKPNMHNDSTPVVGGIFQREGFETALEDLWLIVTSVSLLICKYFNFDDLFEDINVCIHKMGKKSDKKEN